MVTVVQLGARLTYLGFSSEYFLVKGCGCTPRGGKGGSSDSPHAGALTRFRESVDFPRVVVVLDDVVSTVPFEVVDATDPLLCSSSEFFLQGRGGGGFFVAGGGAGWLPTLRSVTEPWRLSGGLLKVFCLTTTGRLLGIGGG